MLSEEQVDLFEEEMRRQFVVSHPGLMLNLSMLCQTVRALRAENEQLQTDLIDLEHDLDAAIDEMNEMEARL